jgi:hypothetical protein
VALQRDGQGRVSLTTIRLDFGGLGADNDRTHDRGQVLVCGETWLRAHDPKPSE